MGMTIKHFIHKRGHFGAILTITALFLAALDAPAVQFTKLFDFNGPNGDDPVSGLVLSGNTLYGTTLVGSTNGNGNGTADGVGTIFRINMDGTSFTNLYSFSSTANGNNNNGGYPNGDLLVLSNILYGTAGTSGAYGNGTVFKINTDGSGFVTLHAFSPDTGPAPYGAYNADGATPSVGLVEENNVLYGVALTCGSGASGTVFKLNADGTGFAVLHAFSELENGTNSDGSSPDGRLVLSSNVLYGTTMEGGPGLGMTGGNGTVFKVNTDGTGFTVLHSFSMATEANPFPPPSIYTNSDGAKPCGSLTLVGNVLYGTALSGGSHGAGTIFKVNTDGTGFATLFTFDGVNHSGPTGSLVLHGNLLYGTCGAGDSGGEVFAININGTGFTSVYVFPGNSLDNYYPNGSGPNGGLVFSGNALYGTTGGGGTNANDGVVFALGPSQPAINKIVLNTNETVTVSCSGDAGFAYRMLATTNLAPPVPWLTVSTNVADTNGNWQFTDPIMTNGYWQTNLVYGGTNSSPPGPGNTGPTNVIGTNVSFNNNAMRFYRAATAP